MAAKMTPEKLQQAKNESAASCMRLAADIDDAELEKRMMPLGCILANFRFGYIRLTGWPNSFLFWNT